MGVRKVKNVAVELFDRVPPSGVSSRYGRRELKRGQTGDVAVTKFRGWPSW